MFIIVISTKALPGICEHYLNNRNYRFDRENGAPRRGSQGCVTQPLRPSLALALDFLLLSYIGVLIIIMYTTRRVAPGPSLSLCRLIVRSLSAMAKQLPSASPYRH